MLSVSGILREIHHLGVGSAMTPDPMMATAVSKEGEDAIVQELGTESDDSYKQQEKGKHDKQNQVEQVQVDREEREDEPGTCESSPRGVLEHPGTPATESDNNSTTTSTGSCGESTGPAPDGAAPAVAPRSFEWRSLITTLLLRKRTMKRLSTFPPSAEGSKKDLRHRQSSAKWTTAAQDMDENQGDARPPMLLRWKPSWRNFDYHELAAATDDFSSDKLIGKGGHAEVYGGRLPDGQLVAVKKLVKKETKEEEERVSDFLSELGIIAHVNHPNAACLLGFSLDRGLHLVLKFSPHGSLASVLHGNLKEKKQLTWEARFKIAVGVAKGLLYLHRDCHRRIIHRDIKASNILLTQDYEPQISDFGLAKWLPEQWGQLVVFPIEGTFGYLAPEYFMHGVVSEKTDVFAYGVLLLEIITGRLAVDSRRQSLVMWAKPLLEGKELGALVDPCLGDEYDPEEMNRLVSVATICIHHLSTARPPMCKVLDLLTGEDKSLVVATAAGRDAAGKLLFDEMEADYTRSTYLNDLNRHKQLALEQ